MSPNRLPQQRHHELEHLAAVGRAQGRPPAELAAQLAALAGITPLWAWRLATGWTRADLLSRLRQLGDTQVDESMLWRWETGERDPSSKHLDRLCQVYQTRPDRLGYGHDYTPASTAPSAAPSDGATRDPREEVHPMRRTHLTSAQAAIGCTSRQRPSAAGPGRAAWTTPASSAATAATTPPTSTSSPTS